MRIFQEINLATYLQVNNVLAWGQVVDCTAFCHLVHYTAAMCIQPDSIARQCGCTLFTYLQVNMRALLFFNLR